MYLPSAFRAYESRGFGAVETVLSLNSKTSVPLIKPEQLFVRVASAATNQVDVKLVEIPFVAKKLLPESNLPSEINPLRVGLDFAGTVVHVGDNATSSFQVGDEVYGLPRLDSMGSFAEYIAIDAELVAHKPKNLSFNEAAAIPCTAQTSYQALIDAGKLQAGQRLLVLGGSSATGGFAIQIAKNIGATVIATTSTRNIELVKSYGADQVVDYKSEDWAEVVETNSIDLIYDCGVEPESWNDRAQRVLKEKTGRFVTIGQPHAELIESPIGASFQRFHTKISALCLNKLTALIEEGKLKVTIDSVFPFDQLPAALVKQKTQRARGKIVIEIDDKQAAGGP